MSVIHSIYHDNCKKDWTDEELMQAQMDLEKLGSQQGTQRALASYDQRVDYGKGVDTDVGHATLRSLMPPVMSLWADAVKALRDSQHNGQFKPFLSILEPLCDEAAAITLQHLISGAMGEQPWTGTLFRIGMEIANEATLAQMKKSDKSTFTKAKHYIQLHHLAHRKEKIIRDLAAKQQMNVESLKLSKAERVLLGTWCAHTMIELLRDDDGYFIETVAVQQQGMVKSKTPTYLKFCKKGLEKIQELKECFVDLAHVVYPMVYPPLPVSQGQLVNYGYLTRYSPPVRLAKTGNKAHRKALKAGHYPVVLDGVNAAMQMRWKVNRVMLALIKELSACDAGYCGLPRETLEQDTVIKPSSVDGQMNPHLFRQWKMQKTAAADRDRKLFSQRATFQLTLSIAEKMLDYPCFYNVWELDKRGRGYSSSALNNQKDDLTRSLILNYEGKALGKRGFYWLTQHLVNLLDTCPDTGVKVSKLSLGERWAWAMEHADTLLIVGSTYRNRAHWKDGGYIALTDKPWQFTACLLEWCEVYKSTEEERENYISYVSVALDATCSGIQILAAGFRCLDTARLVNLVPNDKPDDVYTLVASKVKGKLESMADKHSINSYESALAAKQRLLLEYCKDHALNPTEQLNLIAKRTNDLSVKIDRKLLSLWNLPLVLWGCMQIDIDRKFVKRPVMTFVFSSRQYGFSTQLTDDYFLPRYIKLSEELRTRRGIHLNTLGVKERTVHGFPHEGRGLAEANLLASIIYPTVKETLPKPSAAMDWMMDCAERIGKQNAFVTWRTPLGFPIVQNYRKYKTKRLNCVFSNKRIQTNVRTDVGECDVTKSKAGISPNVVHSLDASLLWLTVVNASKMGIKNINLIHDSFGTHAGNTEAFSQIIRQSFCELFSDDVFSDLEYQFHSQMNAENRQAVRPMPDLGDYELTDILRAVYAFS